MRISKITSEYGNDFSAEMECEHCGAKSKLNSGYHDDFYHTRVIPAMMCASCGKDRIITDGYVDAIRARGDTK